jgi:predicted nucleic acid-binding protein
LVGRNCRRVRLHLDTSVVIRYLTGSPPDAAESARALFAAAADGGLRLFIPDVILIEAGFVLVRVLHLERREVARLLGSLAEAPGVEVERREVVRGALELFQHGRLGLVDAYLTAHALACQDSSPGTAVVASFDQELDKVQGVRRISSPDEL